MSRRVRYVISMWHCAMRKILHGDILWVHDIDYEMLRLFILFTILLLNSTHVDFLTNHPIPILLPTPFHIYPIICFILIIAFPTLLPVYPTNRFVLSIIQLSFYISFYLCLVTCYNHLLYICYGMGVRVTWFPAMVDVTHYLFSTNIRLFPLLS